MLTPEQLRKHYDRLGLPKGARSIIELARNSPPGRSVDTSFGGAGDLKSLKMGHWVNFESFVPEAAAILAMDVDPDILGFWEQPEGGFAYLASGRRRHIHPDFLVLRQSTAGWDDWKRETDLQMLAAEHPDNYIKVGPNRWSCPEREESARALGMTYRLRSADELPAILIRNVEFLRDYMEQTRTVDHERRAAVRAAVNADPGLSLRDLLDRIGPASADDVYSLIVEQDIFVDLGNEALPEPDLAHVYPSLQHARALGIVKVPLTRGAPPVVGSVVFAIGHSICWEGKVAAVVMTARDKTYLRFDGEDEPMEYPTTFLTRLAVEGAIIASPDEAAAQVSSRLTTAVMTASPRRLDMALRRLAALDGQATDAGERSVRRYRSLVTGVGEDRASALLALIPEPHSGPRRSAFSSEVWALADRFIRDYYQTPERPKLSAAYELFRASALELGYIDEQIPCYLTFWRRAKTKDARDETNRRQGSAIAGQMDPMLQPEAFNEEHHWWLSHGAPVHGDYFMHRCHVDHTQLDREVIDPKTGLSLGRPWLSLLIDARTRRVLAMYLALERPSFRTVMRLLRICVRRFGKGPRWLVLDRGPEFRSHYLKRLATFLDMNLHNRPRRKPRHGSVLERLFGATTATVIYRLAGNTQSTRNPRGMTKATNPRNRADEGLVATAQRVAAYLYGAYDSELVHTTLGVTPKAACESLAGTAGEREQRAVAYSPAFSVLTMPPVDHGGTRVVAKGGRGIKDSHFYYWAPELRNRMWWGKKVEVRFDPDNVFRVWSLLGDAWVECQLRGNLALLDGMSHAEVDQAADIVTARLRAIKAKR